jgi:hypothetical protein
MDTDGVRAPLELLAENEEDEVMGLRRRQERKAGERQDRVRETAEMRAAQKAADRIREAAERAYQVEVVEDLGVVAFRRNGSIQVNVTNAAERKLAVKKLRLKKKELIAQKGELTAEIAAIRAENRAKVANPAIAPIEQHRKAIDKRMLKVERAIARIETSASRDSEA